MQHFHRASGTCGSFAPQHTGKLRAGPLRHINDLPLMDDQCVKLQLLARLFDKTNFYTVHLHCELW